MSVPFGERGGRLRGGLDLIAGRYPRFVFGGRVGRLLPVFHFHDEQPDDFERKLQYLAANRYRTVGADDIFSFIRGGSLPERAVALCFDDAWASVWGTAGPLLTRYGFRAILYVIPGRTDDAAACRERTTSVPGSPFATWPELRALVDEGSFEVQSHTFSHAMIPTASTPTGFVTPDFDSSSYLGRPLVRSADDNEDGTRTRPVFDTPEDLGAPLYPARSRMSEAPRVQRAHNVREACLRLVAAEGGRDFFARPDWRQRLESTAAAAGTEARTESALEQQRSIEWELDAARAELNARLHTNTVNHVCLPWGVSGPQTALALERLGIHTAVANRMPGVFAVQPGDDPFWLKRLPNKYIYRLPGEGRRWWFTRTS